MKFATTTAIAFLVAAIKAEEDRDLAAAPGACDAPFLPALRGDAIKTLLSNAHVSNPDAFVQLINERLTIGNSLELIPEAGDAAITGAPIVDGKSGDVDFPHGKLIPLATVGEYDKCTGENVVGVPDGLGAYLVDDNTVRAIVQSESYGSISDNESRCLFVNGDVCFTGSHIQYVDYDRYRLSKIMTSGRKASFAFKSSGEVVDTVYNLKGELVGPRNTEGPTTTGVHYTNTDVNGNWVVSSIPSKADWIMQSLCSAHLEEKHQWGEGIGLEDNIFITNEEWMSYDPAAENVVGIPAHAVDLANKVSYAVGAMTLGGFEKIVEINPQHTDYVVFSPSGYNGNFGGRGALNAKKAMGTRADGTDYVWPQDIVPARIYIGIKGKMEDGSDADPNDFLARNGLRYGQNYGFATELDITRDNFHVGAANGAEVKGKWLPINWMWDGEVRGFAHDGSWAFQDEPKGYEGTNYHFWTAQGRNAPGSKTEHNTPDPRPGISGFVQGSTKAYFGHYYVDNMKDALTNANGGFPTELEATYKVYQGYKDVTSQIELNGKGQTANGFSAIFNQKGGTQNPQFRDIDGLEVIATTEGKIHAVIQEDSGNQYGERMFITSALEHDDDGQELTYYFVAQAGGSKNTRNGVAKVGVPANTNIGGGSHEFSGVFDMSGLLARTGKYNKRWAISADDDGHAKRAADASVEINDKYIMLGLQSHNLQGGVIDLFGADRGGQWLLYQPNIPM